MPPAPLTAATPALHRNRWRLLVLGVAVLAAHGWLLSRWLHRSADADTSAGTVHGTAPVVHMQARATPTATAEQPTAPSVAPATAPLTAQPNARPNPPRIAPPSAPSAPAPPSPPAPQPTAAVPVSGKQPDAHARTAVGDQNIQQNTPLPLDTHAFTAMHSNATTDPAPALAAATPPADNPRVSAATPLTRPSDSPLASPQVRTAPQPPTAGLPGTADTPNGLAATVPGNLRLPPSTTLHYEVTGTRKGIRFPARSTLHFTQDGQRYEARMDIKALLVGTRTQTSKGSVDATTGLQPLRFGDKTKSELATHFDRSRQPPVLRFSANTPDAPLQAFTQDRLSVLFQLAAMLAGDPTRFGPGSTLVVHTAGPRDADLWQFKLTQPEALSLPAGTLTAIHLVRTPMHAYDNQVDIWLAPSLGHLPVRVLWTQANGDTVDQRLSGHAP